MYAFVDVLAGLLIFKIVCIYTTLLASIASVPAQNVSYERPTLSKGYLKAEGRCTG